MVFKSSLVFALAIVFGFSFYIYYKSESNTLSQVRKLTKPHLLSLPEVPYVRIFGKKPSKEIIHLGKMLFNDPVLSRNNDTSCASCHLTSHGFADGNSLSFGSLGRGGPNGDNVGRNFGEGHIETRECGDDSHGFRCAGPIFRNSLSTINVAHRGNGKTDSGLLWDGRFGDLKFQVLLPIHTREELCGPNPVPQDNKKNLFRPGGPFFSKPVTVKHSHLNDKFSGRDFHNYNAASQTVKGVPSFRENGEQSVPNRNECVAIAVAKLRSIPTYRNLFKSAFEKPEISDELLGHALAAFVSTHVSKRTPWDNFVQGDATLSDSEARGMLSFFTDPGKTHQIESKQVKGVGCYQCHSPPFFGGDQFASLGVKSDPRSSLSQPKVIFTRNSFYLQIRGERGVLPQCHLEGKTVGPISPDMGRAFATFDQSDCFKFRVPTLRNIIESFPYFHHGSARGQEVKTDNLKQMAIAGLKQVIHYHLRGPINIEQYQRTNFRKTFYDRFFQLDALIPTEYLEFSKTDSSAQSLSPAQFDDLFNFVAYALWDKESVVSGDLDNDLAHPRTVPSGFSPSITRDQGHQQESPPNSMLTEK